MKKLYLLIISLCLVVFSNAQSSLNGLEWKNNLKTPKQVSSDQIRQDYYQRCKGPSLRTNQYWLSYAIDVDDPQINNYSAVLSGNYLFPDSNVLVNFTDNYGNPVEGSPYVHQLTDVLDPLSVIFQVVDGVTLTESDSYYLDSAAVYYAYDRHTDASVVDTLIIYVFESAIGGTNLPLYYYVSGPGFDVAANYGVDTLFVPFDKYSFSKNKPNVSTSALKTFKFPLTESDSSAYYKFKAFSTNNLLVNAGDKVSMVMAFKPGYAYSEFENIADNYNTLFFLSAQEFPDAYQVYYSGEYNCSSILTTDIRYNINGNGYNGLYIPSYAWIDPFPWQHHEFAYFISDEPVVIGIDEQDQALSNLLLSPNPASDIAQVSFSLKKSSNVEVHISDVAGKEIQVTDLGLLTSGEHFQTLNTSKFAAGVYTVSVNCGGEKVTGKLLVGSKN